MIACSVKLFSSHIYTMYIYLPVLITISQQHIVYFHYLNLLYVYVLYIMAIFVVYI